MIRARHNPGVIRFFNWYIDRLLKKNFSGLYRASDLPNCGERSSCLVILNHFSWWDGFFAYAVFRRITEHTLHVMMLEEQLRQYPYFAKLGAYSIRPGERGSVMESLAYTQGLLTAPDNLVFLYPQGEIQSYLQQDLSFKNGLRFLLSHPIDPVTLRPDGSQAFGAGASLKIIPAGFCINYYNEKQPEVVMRFSAPIDLAEIADKPELLTARFNENLRQLNAAVIGRQFVPFDL